MATTLTYRDIVDLPEWRSLSQPVANNTTTVIGSGGGGMSEDFRCRDYASPLVYFAVSTSIIVSYNKHTDAWHTVGNILGSGGSFGNGSTSVFCPTFSPRGTIAAGATTSKFTLTTALLSSVQINQIANRGDGLGFIVRVIGNGAGGSGKIEERRVIANTSGTTPTVYLDKPLSFTPVSGDTYEFLSGSVLFLNTGTSGTANIFRRYDILTHSSVSLSTTGFIGTIPASTNFLVALDEQHVSHDRNPGEGFLVGAATYDTAGDFTKKCLTATAIAAGTITGQASSGDAAVIANQFRNYQIRIVEDTVNTTAVGQRRRISSNTAGPSPVYTLATNWTVTPSSNCKFVIENDTDRLLAFVGGSTVTYNYFITNLGNTAATANTWDTTSWATRTNAVATGAMIGHAFGISHNNITENNIKPIIYATRGSGAVYDIFDVAGAATGAWTQGLNMVEYVGVGYENIIGSIQDLYNYAYDPHSNKGRYFYFFGGSSSSTASSQRSFMRFDLIGNKLEKIAGPKIGTGNNVPNGKYSFFSVFQDGDTKISFYNTPRPISSTDYFQLMITL